MSHAEQMKALVNDLFYESWDGNLGAMEEHPGLHDIIPFLEHMMDAMTDAEYEIKEQLVDGNWVVTRFETEATHSGEFMGLPPSGERVRMETIVMHQVVDGIIVQQHSQGGFIT
ncbi:MAG: ester cyclase [Chloroflexi bacterium]|nr:ester cyclase [Chloroflexota bacterium]